VGSPRAAASFRAHLPVLAWGPLQAAVWISALLWSSPAPGVPPPLFLPTLVFKLLFLTFTFLSSSLVWHFLPFLKYFFPEAPSSWLWGSAMLCSGPLGAGWNWLCPACGSPGLPSQRPSCSPPPPKPGYGHSVQKLSENLQFQQLF